MVMSKTLRLTAVCAHIGLGVAYGTVLAWKRKMQGEPFDRSLPLAMAIFRLSQQMGGLFPKVAQIVSTRFDLMSGYSIGLLANARDRLELAPTYSHVGRPSGQFIDRSITRIGSGAIAEVFLVESKKGHKYTLKERRPNIDLTIRTDISVLNSLSVLAGRIQLFKSLNISENIKLLSDLLKSQLDFIVERRNLIALRNNLADHVVVPRVFGKATEERIFMEYVEHLIDITDVERHEGRNLAARIMRLVYRMIFIDGLVHCDLHPGNIYIGIDSQLIIVDAGFCSRIGNDVRLDFREFFLAICLKRSEVLARTIIRYSTGGRLHDQEGSIAMHCANLVEKHSRLKAREFHLVSFIKDLYAIYSLHGLTMTSDFFSITYALVVVEGAVAKLDPDLDFQALALKFLIENRGEISDF